MLYYTVDRRKVCGLVSPQEEEEEEMPMMPQICSWGKKVHEISDGQ